MNEFDKDNIYELMRNVEEVLDLDDNYLKDRMKENPDEIIIMLRSGYLLLEGILEEALSQDEQ